MITYITKDYDTVDLIVWRQYGTTSGRVVEQVLESNLNLASLGPLLPAGVTIYLPPLTRKPQEVVRLWS